MFSNRISRNSCLVTLIFILSLSFVFSLSADQKTTYTENKITTISPERMTKPSDTENGDAQLQTNVAEAKINILARQIALRMKNPYTLDSISTYIQSLVEKANEDSEEVGFTVVINTNTMLPDYNGTTYFTVSILSQPDSEGFQNILFQKVVTISGLGFEISDFNVDEWRAIRKEIENSPAYIKYLELRELAKRKNTIPPMIPTGKLKKLVLNRPQRIAISGIGRIGRLWARQLWSSENPNFDIAAIVGTSTKGLSEEEAFAKQFKYAQMVADLIQSDTNYGYFAGTIEAVEENGKIYIVAKNLFGQQVGKSEIISRDKPENYPWTQLEIDTVIEASGAITKYEDVEKHYREGNEETGQTKFFLQAPFKGGVPEGVESAQIVNGVNNALYDPEMKGVSNASCTTNAMGPALMALVEAGYGIIRGSVKSDHSVTLSQNQVDGAASKGRGPAGAKNIIPTSSGVAKAANSAIPGIGVVMDGFAMRTPTMMGSMADITLVVEGYPTREKVLEDLKKFAKQGVLAVGDYRATRDIGAMDHPSIIAEQLVQVIPLPGSNASMIKLPTWYDNEWGYTNNSIDCLTDQYLVAEGKVEHGKQTQPRVIVTEPHKETKQINPDDYEEVTETVFEQPVGVALVGNDRLTVRELIRLMDDKNFNPAVLIDTDIEKLAGQLNDDNVYLSRNEIISFGETEDGIPYITINGKKILSLKSSEIEGTQLADYGVDILLETTGKMKKETIDKLVEAGARKVVSVNPKLDASMGQAATPETLTTDESVFVESVSLTEGISAITDILDEMFDVNGGMVSLISPVDANSAILDRRNEQVERGIGILHNIVLTNADSIDQLERYNEDLQGSVGAIQNNVPNKLGQVQDMQLHVKAAVTAEDVENALKMRAQKDLKGIIAVESLTSSNQTWGKGEAAIFLEGSFTATPLPDGTTIIQFQLMQDRENMKAEAIKRAAAVLAGTLADDPDRGSKLKELAKTDEGFAKSTLTANEIDRSVQKVLDNPINVFIGSLQERDFLLIRNWIEENNPNINIVGVIASGKEKTLKAEAEKQIKMLLGFASDYGPLDAELTVEEDADGKVYVVINGTKKIQVIAKNETGNFDGKELPLVDVVVDENANADNAQKYMDRGVGNVFIVDAEDSPNTVSLGVNETSQDFATGKVLGVPRPAVNAIGALSGVLNEMGVTTFTYRSAEGPEATDKLLDAAYPADPALSRSVPSNLIFPEYNRRAEVARTLGIPVETVKGSVVKVPQMVAGLLNLDMIVPNEIASSKEAVIAWLKENIKDKEGIIAMERMLAAVQAKNRPEAAIIDEVSVKVLPIEGTEYSKVFINVWYDSKIGSAKRTSRLIERMGLLREGKVAIEEAETPKPMQIADELSPITMATQPEKREVLQDIIVDEPPAIGINGGAGRIGADFIRQIVGDPNINVRAIPYTSAQDLYNNLINDTVHGKFPGELEVGVEADGTEYVLINGQKKIYIIDRQRDPADINWNKMGIDIVMEVTGKFTGLEAMDKHRSKEGVNDQVKIIIQGAPFKADNKELAKKAIMAVYGVNHKDIDLKISKDGAYLFSPASCTTNCLAPAAKAISDLFKGITTGAMITWHALTASNTEVTSPIEPLDLLEESGLKKAGRKIDPVGHITATGGAAATGKVVTENGKPRVNLDGYAFRFESADGSAVTSTFDIAGVPQVAGIEMKTADELKEMSQEEVLAWKAEVENSFRDYIIQQIKERSETDLRGVIALGDQVTSSQIINSQVPSIVKEDDLFVTVDLASGITRINMTIWYDNESGFTSNYIKLVKYLSQFYQKTNIAEPESQGPVGALVAESIANGDLIARDADNISAITSGEIVTPVNPEAAKEAIEALGRYNPDFVAVDAVLGQQTKDAITGKNARYIGERVTRNGNELIKVRTRDSEKRMNPYYRDLTKEQIEMLEKLDPTFNVDGIAKLGEKAVVAGKKKVISVTMNLLADITLTDEEITVDPKDFAFKYKALRAAIRNLRLPNGETAYDIVLVSEYDGTAELLNAIGYSTEDFDKVYTKADFAAQNNGVMPEENLGDHLVAIIQDEYKAQQNVELDKKTDILIMLTDAEKEKYGLEAMKTILHLVVTGAEDGKSIESISNELMAAVDILANNGELSEELKELLGDENLPKALEGGFKLDPVTIDSDAYFRDLRDAQNAIARAA